MGRLLCKNTVCVCYYMRVYCPTSVHCGTCCACFSSVVTYLVATLYCCVYHSRVDAFVCQRRPGAVVCVAFLVLNNTPLLQHRVLMLCFLHDTSLTGVMLCARVAGDCCVLHAHADMAQVVLLDGSDAATM